MAVEIYRLYAKSLGRPEKVPLSEILRILHGLSQEEKWAMIRQGIGRAADMVSQEKPVLFFLVDETSAGGYHFVRALYDPQERSALIEIPEESHQQGGRFPTVLHALEVIVGTVALANQIEKSFTPNGAIIYPHKGSVFPDVNFIPDLNEQANKTEVVLVPLTVDTSRTNVVAFHPQARHINPEALARAYYQVIQNDTDLPKDLIRHTMLVQAENTLDGKNEVTVSILTKEAARQYSLMRTERISSFGKNNTKGNVIVRRI